MRARRWLLSWLIVMIVFAVIDIAWITTVVLPMYEDELGSAMSESLDPVAALAFYTIFTAGITHYGVAPGSDRGTPGRAVRGGLYGFFTYSTYALTLKVILDTSWALTLSDIVRGAVVCAITAAITSLILRNLPSTSEAE